MSLPIPFLEFRRFALLASALLLAGCSGGSSPESFHPKGDAAREALSAALTAWQNGETKDELRESTDPAVEVAEPAWVDGTKLKSFEIVEDLTDDMPRKFSVNITLEGAAAPENVTYVVVGKDLLWVLRGGIHAGRRHVIRILEFGIRISEFTIDDVGLHAEPCGTLVFSIHADQVIEFGERHKLVTCPQRGPRWR